MERRVFCTVAFVAGVVAPRLPLTWSVGVLTALCLAGLWRESLRRPAAWTLALVAYLVGGGRAAVDQALAAPPLPETTLTVQGTILEPPRAWGGSAVFFFGIDSMEKPVKLLVRWSGCRETLEVGDRWELDGRLVRGEEALYPGAFDQEEWLWGQRALGVLLLHQHSDSRFLSPPLGRSPYQLGYRARAWMLRRLERIEDETARSLVAGVVFGETQALSPELQEQFRRTGTSHLLAASGMNVALLAGLIMGLGKILGFGPWRTAPFAIPAVIGYAFLAGCGPSITRAATGATFALLALSWGRTSNAWNSLALSIWLLLLWDPRQVYDLGFQLSAVAVVGLIGGPAAPSCFRILTGSVVMTVSASLVTLPFFWWAFGEFSSTLLLSNLILGPLVELLFPLGLLVTLLPLEPLYWCNEVVAKTSLLLVGRLSALGDPVLLTRLTVSGSLLLGLALLCWLGGGRWRVRLLALPLVGAAILLNLSEGSRHRCPPGQLVVRRAGASRPIYWLSTPGREVLVLTEAWQEGRGRAMLRRMGCLIQPEVRVLDGAPLRFHWGEIRWAEVAPLLPPERYLEVVFREDGYLVETWPGFDARSGGQKEKDAS